MWWYYGGKGRLAPYYPAPVYDRIVEPFAGAAGYSTLWHAREVLLLDLDERVVAVWHYLQRTTVERLLDLPVLQQGERISDQPGLCEEERLLLGCYAHPGAMGRDAVTSMGAGVGTRRGAGWRVGRQRLVAHLDHCRHWDVRHGSYEDAPDVEATWFVDPPYQGHAGAGGDFYRHGAKALDFQALGAWVQARRGQVVACDYENADWLPFRPLRVSPSNASNVRTTDAVRRMELVYLQGPQRLAGRLGVAKHRPGVPTTLYG